MTEQHPRHDLREIAEVTVSTGCFDREDAAVKHLISLRKVLAEHGITARIGFLTSVIQTDSAFEALADAVAPFVLRLTAECFTRRDLLLKASKARQDQHQMPDLLRRARRLGWGTSFTYIVGLDPLVQLRAGITDLAEHVSEFPNVQVYQAHNSIMAGLRVPGADQLEFYLRARVEIEKIFGSSGLRPIAWECYRPLLSRPIEAADVKARPTGHWGTVPGTAWALTHIALAASTCPNLTVTPILGVAHSGAAQLALAWNTGSPTADKWRFTVTPSGQ